MRFLYIVAREDSGQIEQVFAWLSRDMATATVELMFDRRSSERRKRTESVTGERRNGDRRRKSVDVELAQVGWARVRIE